MASVKKNYLYNLVYQAFSLITPFITTPYLSRMLGSVGVGQYAYTYAIIYYFVLAGSLGFGYYSQREIAFCQHDRYFQTKLFWEIVLARGFAILVSVAIFFLMLFTGCFGEYSTLLALWSVTLIASAFDISFFFQGNDLFGQLALRNIIIRIIGIVLIFILVKGREDVTKYVFLQSAISILSNLSLWPLLSKMIVKVPVKMLCIKQHFVPTIKLFIPTLAVSVYTILDRILIGVLVTGTVVTTLDNGDSISAKISDVENGYYEQAEKIVKIVLTIFFSLSVVMVTRNSDELSKGNKLAFLNNIYSTSKYLWLLGSPLVFGILATASNFSPWFFGPGFEKVPILMSLFSPLILIIGFSNIIGRQFLIPLKKDSNFTKSIVFGAIINLLLNLLLITNFYSYGAAISTVISEFSVTMFMLFYVRKDLSIASLFEGLGTYLSVSIFMFIVVKIVSIRLTPSPGSTMLLTAIGVIVYTGTLYVLRNQYFICQMNNLFKKNK